MSTYLLLFPRVLTRIIRIQKTFITSEIDIDITDTGFSDANLLEQSSQVEAIDAWEAEQSMEVEPYSYGEVIDMYMSETEFLAEGQLSVYSEEAIDELETALSLEEGPPRGVEPSFHEEAIDTSAPSVNPTPHNDDQNHHNNGQNHTGLLSSSLFKF